MRKTAGFVVMGILAMATLLMQACATRSASQAGDEQRAKVEQIDEPVIKHIPPPEFSMTASRPKPAMRAEVSSPYASMLSKGSLTDVLFDFDRAVLRTDALPVLESNARMLRDEGVTRLLLEGRGDEVGTADYNIVLGDRRAKNVKAYLQDLGLVLDLRTTSYGKNRPLCFQHSEDCMQRNRSVRFVVKE